MVLFMADDLECLTRRLLKCVVKKSVLDKAITPFSVSSINLFSDKKKTFINENCLPMTKVKLPTGTKMALEVAVMKLQGSTF